MDTQLWGVLECAWEKPFYTSGDFARTHSRTVALAASLGWISNITPGGEGWSTRWHITAPGQIALKHRYDMETYDQ